MTIDEKVKRITVEHLGCDPDKVILDANYETDLGADSLDMVELVMAFEDEFKIEIPDAEANAVKTVGQAITLIAERVPA